MILFAWYLLKVSICSAFLYGYYWLFLRNKIFHAYNRFYLLAAIVLSLVLPLLKFQVPGSTQPANTSLIQMLNVVNSPDAYMEEVIIQSHQNSFSLVTIAALTWSIISLGLILFFLRSIARIYWMKRRHPNTKIDDITLIHTNDKATPFSFFKNIFWNNAIDLDSSTGRKIFTHEMIHVREKHSHDKIFINVVLSFFWCNPVFWLIRNELYLVHEFLADKKAVENGDSSVLANMILQSTYPGRNFTLTSNFFFSPIKRRITMLGKQHKTQINYFSRLLVIPVIALAFFAFSLKATQPLLVSSITEGKPLIVVVDAGHGGTDNGAVSDNGLQEKNLNLALAKAIKALNINPAIQIYLTRESDIYQTPKEKAALSVKFGADLFISVHAAATENKMQTDKSGMEIYVAKDNYKNSFKSKLFASAIINVFQENYSLPVQSNPMQRQVGIWVLQENTCPSVLIEAGYMSNEKDVQYLSSENGRTTFAKNVLKALDNYAAAQNTSATNDSHNAVGSVRDEKNVISPKSNTDTVSVSHEILVKQVQATPDTAKKPLYNPADDPIIMLSGIAGPKINIKDLEKLKTIMLSSPAFEFSDATVYFAGKGFPNVVMATINGNSLYKINTLMNRIQVGTNMVFDNVRVKDAAGRMMEIKGKAFSFIDDNFTDKPASDYIVYVGIDNAVYISGKKIDVLKVKLITDKGKIEVTEGQHFIWKVTSIGDAHITALLDGNEIAKFHFKAQRVPDDLGKNLRLSDPIYLNLDENSQATQPSFPGGKTAWLNYLKTKLNASTPIDEGWKAGTYKILVKFLVDEKGNLSEFSTSDYAGTKTSEQSVDLIKKGPRWIPGTVNGKNVTAWVSQPITYVVSEQ
ncbi:MAG: N-acetylmuramoyl-L-alanine amidase [Ferruginibacter sp.]